MSIDNHKERYENLCNASPEEIKESQYKGLFFNIEIAQYERMRRYAFQNRLTMKTALNELIDTGLTKKEVKK